ncbi:NAD-dependent epimerase/dehydratase family protein [Quadrisphaera setariae]|uniref:NAD(P)-dependent oxidoreductase n=1 Tax=Quadrisphaera setariae TaxID=2593304 RepID=A0A5C8ZD27_9ACTN|nr:NAD(P)-dependent oxidoreductase [Quadrisphaera setariae]TXR55061.1 NAD(P)-dependent oxidoreductase [Quadrisphaera setariae]
MPFKVVVTGATGFMGMHLTSRLMSMGAEVAIVVRGTSRIPEWMASRAHVITADASGSWTGEVRSYAPDVCFHLAAQSIQVHDDSTVGHLLDANVIMGTQLLQALSHLEGVRFVNVGSVWQHHDSRPYGPSSLYAATKQAFVDIVQFYAECCGVRAATVEFPDTYGPADERKKLLRLLVDASETGVALQMSPGGQVIEMIHIDDVVDALLATLSAASHEAPSFRVPGEVLRLKEFVGVVSLMLGAEVPVHWGARPYRPRETMETWNHFPCVADWERKRSLFTELPVALASLRDRANTSVRIPAQPTKQPLEITEVSITSSDRLTTS